MAAMLAGSALDDSSAMVLFVSTVTRESEKVKVKGEGLKRDVFYDDIDTYTSSLLQSNQEVESESERASYACAS